MVLNDQLYDLLTERLGPVHVANEGDALTGDYLPDPFSGRTTLSITFWGETYYVNCPFCSDSRQRLSINHRYGVYDPVSESDNLQLANCFNEDCLKDPGMYRALKEMVFGFMNRDQRRRLLVVRGGRPPVTQSSALTQAPSPGVVHELTSLPENHPALDYLRGRGFDPGEVSSAWRVLYCSQADPDYSLAQDRLIIPIIQGDLWVGWLARFVGERAWKALLVPKYQAMPGLRKAQMLYNHDRARQQPVLVVCEGPTDVWRVGPAGVAVLGKQASVQQRQLIVEGWADKPVLVLLDGDAQLEAHHLARDLRPFLRGGLARVALPRGRDPGSYGRTELWGVIRDQASSQGVVLPETEAAQSLAVRG